MTEPDDSPWPGDEPDEQLHSPTTEPEQEEVNALRAALAERDGLLEAERTASRQLVERLREALLATEPDVEPELVTGETLEEVEASFVQARALVQRVRERVSREAPIAVPAGAPGRAGLAPRTAFEKIRAGLTER
ncbi:MAG: hypothetical protein M0R74_05605 [Dehalococcoidia bacterium]|nr:hypothetical protein [Dehalococcoidia bacterium]